MNTQMYFNASLRQKKHFSVRPRAFAFFDKWTGARRFEVKADTYGRMPVEQAVTLLAAHCLLRKQTPSDFEVMVKGSESVFEVITKLATNLIRASPMLDQSVHITAREREVLGGILESLSNKEIGNKLSLSVRTVKFHVSSLLSKFGVRSRSGLILKAADLFSNVQPHAMPRPFQLAAGNEHEIVRALEHPQKKYLELDVLARRSRA